MSLAALDRAMRWPLTFQRSRDDAREERARVDRLVRENLDFVWRLLRRLGLPPADADDASQQVFLTLSQRLRDVEAGKERAFLYGAAVRIASRAHRGRRRRREQTDEDVVDAVSELPTPEEACAREQALHLLDQVLETFPLELRVVFVLYEVEELTMAEIAESVGVPQGTIASRLRRARQRFERAVGALDESGPARSLGEGASPHG